MRKKQLQVDKKQLFFVGVLMAFICPGKGCDNNQTDVLSDFQDAESTNIIESAVKMQISPDCKNTMMTTHIFKGHIFDDNDNHITVKREANKAKRELFKKKEGKIEKVRIKRRKDKERRRKKYYDADYDDETIAWADQNDDIVKKKYETRSTLNKYHLIRNNKTQDDVSTQSKADLLFQILKNYNRRSGTSSTLKNYDPEIDLYEESTEFSPELDSVTEDYRKVIKMIKKNARTPRIPGYDSIDQKDTFDMLTIHDFFLTSHKKLPKKEILSSKSFLNNKNQIYFKSNPSKSSSTSILPSSKDLEQPKAKLLRKSKSLTDKPQSVLFRTKQTKINRRGKLKQNSFPTYAPMDVDFHDEHRRRINPMLNKRSASEDSPLLRAAEEQHDKVMDILKMLGIVILVFAGLLMLICGALLCCRRKKMCLVYILKAFKSPRQRAYPRPCHPPKPPGPPPCSPCPPPCPPPCIPRCPPPCPPPYPPPCPPRCPVPCPPRCVIMSPPSEGSECSCMPTKVYKRTLCCNYCQSPDRNYTTTAFNARRNKGFRPFTDREAHRK